MEGDEKRSPWRWVKYFLLVFLLVIFAAWALLAYGYYVDSPRQTIRAAEELIPTIPDLKKYVTAHQSLFEEVQLIFNRHSFQYMGRSGDNIFVVSENGDSEDLSSTDLFTAEEKEKIVSLFSAEGPIVQYCVPRYFNLKDEYRSDGIGRCELKIANVPDSELDAFSEYVFYMEEVFDGWYIYVTSNVSPRGIDFDEYKSQREDHGIVRIEDTETVSMNPNQDP